MKNIIRVAATALVFATLLFAFPAFAVSESNEKLPEVTYMMVSETSPLYSTGSKHNKLTIKAYRCEVYEVIGQDGSNTIIRDSSGKYLIDSKKLKKVDETASARYMIRAEKDVKVYSGPSRKYKVVGTLRKGQQTPLLLEQKDAGGSRWAVALVNGKVGVMHYDDIDIIYGTSRVQGYVQAKAGKTVQVYAGPHVKSDRYDGFATLKQSDGGRTKVGEYDDWTLIKVPNSLSIAYVKTKDVDTIDKSTKVEGYLLARQAMPVYTGMRGVDEKAGELKPGELVPVYGGLGSAVVILFKDELNLVSSIYDFKIIPLKPESKQTVQAVKDTTLYAGAGAKFKKLGTIRKDTSVALLYTYGDWHVVWSGSSIGCIAKKDCAA